MFDVFIRREDDTDGNLIGQFMPDQIEALVDLFKKFPIFDKDTSTVLIFSNTQFVVGKDCAFFEIVVTEEN